MQKLVLPFLFSLLFFPAAAQADMTRSTIPIQRNYNLQKIPGTNKSVLNYSTTECRPPEKLIGRHQDVLKTLKFDHPIRVLPPGAMKTMDFNAKRINFGIDHRGYIRAISCG